MLRSNTLKRALLLGQPQFGLFCSTPAPAMVEMIGCAGFDFVVIDTEHTLVNPETLEHMLRAAEAIGMTTLVRVPDASPGMILRALDAGVQGIVVPRVRTPQQAEAAVRASRYHPDGERGLNTGRPAGFGRIAVEDYIRQANAEITVVIMIEDQQGVEALQEILCVPGIDMVLEGAADLSQSLGLPWQTRHPRVRETLDRIHNQAQQRGVPFCALPRAAADFAAWWAKGVRSFILGDERALTFRALRAHLQQFTQSPQSSLTAEEARRHVTD